MSVEKRNWSEKAQGTRRYGSTHFEPGDKSERSGLWSVWHLGDGECGLHTENGELLIGLSTDGMSNLERIKDLHNATLTYLQDEIIRLRKLNEPVTGEPNDVE